MEVHQVDRHARAWKPILHEAVGDHRPLRFFSGTFVGAGTSCSQARRTRPTLARLSPEQAAGTSRVVCQCSYPKSMISQVGILAISLSDIWSSLTSCFARAMNSLTFSLFAVFHTLCVTSGA